MLLKITKLEYFLWKSFWKKVTCVWDWIVYALQGCCAKTYLSASKLHDCPCGMPLNAISFPFLCSYVINVCLLQIVLVISQLFNHREQLSIMIIPKGKGWAEGAPKVIFQWWMSLALTFLDCLSLLSEKARKGFI